MKVLLLTSTLGVYGEVNGVATTYKGLIPYYKANNIELDVITYSNENKVEKDGSVTIYHYKPTLPVKVDNIYIETVFLSIPLFKEVFSTDYDIIHATSPDALGLFGLFVHQRKKTPILYYFHTDVGAFAYERAKGVVGEHIARIPKKVIDYYSKIYCNETDMVLVESPDLYKYLNSSLDTKVRLVSNATDTDMFTPSKKTLSNEIPVVINSGRVTKEKNLDFLGRIKKETENEFVLKIVGEGDYLNGLKKNIRDALYTGKLAHPDLAVELANSDLYVFTSKADTFGLVIREAMASGLCVVAFNVGGPKAQIENGVNGFLVDTDEEFINQVDYLLAHPDIAKAIGQKARESVMKYSFKASFEVLIDLYREVLNK